jgi:hypothetical protein
MFEFFRQPIEERRRSLWEQYEDAEFLSFCMCDAGRDEPAAGALHDALARLTAAGCLSKNGSTEVWGFGAGRGLASEVDRLMDEERSLVPAALAPSELLARYPQVQGEIADYLGDLDLDPVDSGIVRRVGVRLLPGSATEKDLE